MNKNEEYEERVLKKAKEMIAQNLTEDFFPEGGKIFIGICPKSTTFQTKLDSVDIYVGSNQ